MQEKIKKLLETWNHGGHPNLLKPQPNKNLVRWNNPTKFFGPNIYNSKNIADQRMYKMQTQNLLTRL